MRRGGSSSVVVVSAIFRFLEIDSLGGVVRVLLSLGRRDIGGGDIVNVGVGTWKDCTGEPYRVSPNKKKTPTEIRRRGGGWGVPLDHFVLFCKHI